MLRKAKNNVNALPVTRASLCKWGVSTAHKANNGVSDKKNSKYTNCSIPHPNKRYESISKVGASKIINSKL